MGGYGGDAAGDGNSGTDNVVQETATGAINGSLDTPTFYNGVLYYVGGYDHHLPGPLVSSDVEAYRSFTQLAPQAKGILSTSANRASRSTCGRPTP